MRPKIKLKKGMASARIKDTIVREMVEDLKYACKDQFSYGNTNVEAFEDCTYSQVTQCLKLLLCR